MGEKTEKRPHGFKTEREAWDEDTKDLEDVKEIVDNGLVNTENRFSLFSKVLAVSDRTSLSTEEKYIERMRYCNRLQEEIGKSSAVHNASLEVENE